jgi:hypothetical protein
MQQTLTPEAQKEIVAAYDTMIPLIMELRAKQDEFTAKLYSGADNKTIEALGKEIARLQARVTESQLALQQQLARSGVPLHHVAGGGMMGGGGKRGCVSCPR